MPPWHFVCYALLTNVWKLPLCAPRLSLKSKSSVFRLKFGWIIRALLEPEGVYAPVPLAGMSCIATRVSRRPSDTLIHLLGTQAYVLYSRSEAGVPRGMACIAAFLLAVLGPSREEDIFWTFVGLLENRVPRSCVLEVCTLALIFIFKCSSKARNCALLCLGGMQCMSRVVSGNVTPMILDTWVPPSSCNVCTWGLLMGDLSLTIRWSFA